MRPSDRGMRSAGNGWEFRDDLVRVRFAVADEADAHAPVFAVHVLRADAPPAAAFDDGTEVFRGRDALQAWSFVIGYISHPVSPPAEAWNYFDAESFADRFGRGLNGARVWVEAPEPTPGSLAAQAFGSGAGESVEPPPAAAIPEKPVHGDATIDRALEEFESGAVTWPTLSRLIEFARGGWATADAMRDPSSIWFPVEMMKPPEDELVMVWSRGADEPKLMRGLGGLPPSSLVGAFWMHIPPRPAPGE